MTTVVALARAAASISAAWPGVQRAHRRHQPDRAGELGAGGEELGAGSNDLSRQHLQDRCGLRARSSRPAASARSAVRRAIARYDGRTSGAERCSVARCVATVATSPRATGPVSAASPRRSTLSSDAAEQRRDQSRAASATPAPASSPSASFTSVTRWLDADGERRVIERTRRLRHPHRLAAHLDDERLGDRAQLLERGHAERRAGQPVEVLGASGEGHHRVQGEREHAAGRRGVEHPDALRARGVRRRAGPARQAPVSASPATSRRRTSSGTASSTKSAAATVSSAGSTRSTREHPLGPAPGLGRHPADGDDLVAGAGERGAQRAADPADPDDPDAQPRGSSSCQRRSLASAGRIACEPTAGPNGPARNGSRTVGSHSVSDELQNRVAHSADVADLHATVPTLLLELQTLLGTLSATVTAEHRARAAAVPSRSATGTTGSGELAYGVFLLADQTGVDVAEALETHRGRTWSCAAGRRRRSPNTAGRSRDEDADHRRQLRARRRDGAPVRRRADTTSPCARGG